MTPSWTIEFSKTFVDTFEKLDPVIQKRIYHFLNTKILTHPDPIKLAKPLQGTFKGLHRFRIGAYRVLVQIHKSAFLIVAIDVDHRKKVYR